MLKRSLIAAGLLAAQTLLAASYDYEFSPLVGVDIPEGNLNLENELIVGGEFMFNRLSDSLLKPELSVYYATKTDFKNSNFSTDIWRFGIGGVYEYENVQVVTPFAKAGIGYENMSELHYGNTNSLYADAGAGLKLPLTSQLGLKAEAIYMLKYNDNRRDSNLMLLAGLTYAFGEAAQKAAPAEEPKAAEEPAEPVEVVEEVVAVVIIDTDKDGVADENDRCANTPAGVAVGKDGCELDTDKDGVVDSKDRCPATRAGVAVDAQGCALDTDKDGVVDTYDRCANTPAGVAIDADGCPKDGDKDGVFDTYDQCPNTPEGFEVTKEGCAKTFKLDVVFKSGSADLNSADMDKINAFVAFMNANNYDAEIVGRTDDTGAASYNRTLSLKRAQTVMNLLIDKGIDAKRLKAVGKGEDDPLVPNDSPEGRAANRSVRAELIR